MKSQAINRAWERWPDVDREQVAELVSAGWDAAKADDDPDFDPLEDGAWRDASDRNAWELAVSNERARQIAKGYDAAHDDEHGVDHLLMFAQSYIYRGDRIAAAALIEAAREALARGARL